ncbi:5949_t:CDS:1, partial [Dentiscutata heterogama]
KNKEENARVGTEEKAQEEAIEKVSDWIKGGIKERWLSFKNT